MSTETRILASALLAVLAAFVAGIAIGRGLAPSQGAVVNDLLAVGFVLTDPNGHEVGRFDE
jgi:hypothetical protein